VRAEEVPTRLGWVTLEHRNRKRRGSRFAKGKRKEPGRRFVQSHFIHKKERDACSNTQCGRVVVCTRYLLKRERRGHKMALNFGAGHFPSDDPRIKVEILAPLRYLKMLEVNEPEFIAPSHEVQLNIPVEPTGGPPIFARGTSNVIRRAKSLLNLRA
jgi:hypothetical protein